MSEPPAPFFTPKLSAAEVDVTLQAVDAGLRKLNATLGDKPEPAALEALEALEAARAKLEASRAGLDLATQQHYSFHQLSELGEIGA